MPRNRIIYQSEGLYCGPAPATGYHLYGVADPTGWASKQRAVFTGISGPGGETAVRQLQRIQNANYSFNIARQDVNQFGELAAIDRVVLESPTVTLDFSYYLCSLVNEHLLGFSVRNSGDDGGDFSAISGFLNKETDERNYFIKTVKEGQDDRKVLEEQKGDSPTQNVIGIGNGFLTSYTTEAAIGDFPTVSVSVEALNMAFDAGTSGNFIPAVTPTDGKKNTTEYYHLPSGQEHSVPHMLENDGFGNPVYGTTGDYISALRPGDITLDILDAGTLNQAMGGAGSADELGDAGLKIGDAKIQSYSLSFDLAREPLQKLGNKYAFAREITFPVTVTCTVDAQMGDMYTGNLSDVIEVNKDYDLLMKIGAPGTVGDGANTRISYKLKKAKLDSQEFTSDIGTNKSVSLTFSSQIGGPAQTDRGLFVSGFIANGF